MFHYTPLRIIMTLDITYIVVWYTCTNIVLRSSYWTHKTTQNNNWTSFVKPSRKPYAIVLAYIFHISYTFGHESQEKHWQTVLENPGKLCNLQYLWMKGEGDKDPVIGHEYKYAIMLRVMWLAQMQAMSKITPSLMCQHLSQFVSIIFRLVSSHCYFQYFPYSVFLLYFCYCEFHQRSLEYYKVINGFPLNLAPHFVMQLREHVEVPVALLLRRSN